MQQESFISVDWGTSNLRIRYVNVPSLEIIEEVVYPKGIKFVHLDCIEQDADRKNFFLTFLASQLQKFKTTIPSSVEIVISGMASSSIGLQELPYANLPFDATGKTLYKERIINTVFENPITLISGVKAVADVMRGEEIEIVGLLAAEDTKTDAIFVLPGTHSKHIYCEKGKVYNFATFMTGELFEVIRKHTILRNSLEKSPMDATAIKAFDKGVLAAVDGVSILNELFKIRAFDLFEIQSAAQNFYFLSGLLIGEELKNLRGKTAIKLCAGGDLFELYNLAIEKLGLQEVTSIIDSQTVEQSVVKGQWRVMH